MSSARIPNQEVLSTARPKYPYPGLRPFETNEWSIFFGRERMVDDVIDRLAAHRLVLIHGSSGSGKSSLVRAGVLPKLARQHLIAGALWRTCSMRPSGGPVWNLAKELARLEGNADSADRIGQIVGEFNRRGATLSSVVGSLKSFADWRLCVLIDQFEELFRFERETSREEAELFVDLLVRSDVEPSEPTGGTDISKQQAAVVHVVITMRSEFLGECARFSGLAEAINRAQYLVPPMDRDALLRAIRRPAHLYGGEVNLDLAERLIADSAGREDELPLIQHGLMLMWHEALAKAPAGGKFTLGPTPLEAAGGLARMLSAHADAVVKTVAPDPERRDTVERLFRALTDVKLEGQAIRRPQTFRELLAVTGSDPDVLHTIVDALRSDGVSFLTPYAPEPIAEGTPVDIGHEALIRCWNQIADPQNGWLKREFDDGLVWHSLLVEAKSFERDKRRVLSPVNTEERWEWWGVRRPNDAWAERYGDNFGLVDRLLAASRKAAGAAKRRQLLLRYFVSTLLVGVLAALAWVNQSFIAEQWRWWAVTRPYAAAHVLPYVLSAAAERALKPGDYFKECAQDCPEMVLVPGGSFLMGGSQANEKPQHPVTFVKPFAVAKYQLTFADWDACVTGGGCSDYRPADQGWGRGRQPVINVDWNDARQYVQWLRKVTGKNYRLLSDAEYEYATRAGTTTAFPWGDEIKLNGMAMANCNGCGSQWDNRQPAPVGSFQPNKFGLYDMVGNVSEWVEDCYHASYDGAPKDGAAVSDDCSVRSARVVRGGSWYKQPPLIQSTTRYGSSADTRSNSLGFRVARTLAGPF
jgi:formylglycine-generating enzyme required for sulfatase activity